MKHLIIALGITLALLVGCDDDKLPSPLPQFKLGQLVKVKINGEKAQVLYVFTGINRYKCRVGGLHQERRDGFLSKDTEIVRYKTIVFHEFEIEPWTK